MNELHAVPPNRGPTYVTVEEDTAGARHYAEWNPDFTGPVRVWTVHSDGRREEVGGPWTAPQFALPCLFYDPATGKRCLLESRMGLAALTPDHLCENCQKLVALW